MPLYIDLFKTVISDVCINSFVLQATDCPNQNWEHKLVNLSALTLENRISGWDRALSTWRGTPKEPEKNSQVWWVSWCLEGSLFLQAFFFFFKVTFQNFLKSATVTIFEGETWVLFSVLISYLLADKFWHLSINTLKIPPKKPSTR